MTTSLTERVQSGAGFLFKDQISKLLKLTKQKRRYRFQ
jgi:hypothetical protein